MATKDNPGAFDCYANAKNDEPMFVLLARDKASPAAVRYWCLERIKTGKNSISDPQITEAYQCATAMEEYQAKLAAPKPVEEPKPTVDTL